MTQQILKLDEPVSCARVVGPEELEYETDTHGGKLLAVVYDDVLETMMSFVEDKNAGSYPSTYYDSTTGKSWNVPAFNRIVPAAPVVVRKARFLVVRDSESKLAQLHQQVSSLKSELSIATQKIKEHDKEVAELNKKHEHDLRALAVERDRFLAIVTKRDEEDRERERAREAPSINRFGQIDIED